MDDEELNKFFNNMLESVLNRFGDSINLGPNCPECGSPLVETQTLHTEDEEIKFYECENCGHPQTV